MRFYKQLRKRGLALFMALVMCLSLVQVTAFADDELNANDAAGSDVVLSEDTVPPTEDSHEHVWDEGVTTPPADCVTDGETIYTCTAEGCGATKTEPVPAGHKSVVDVRVEPTETEPGLTEGSHCEICGAILTAQETIPATGAAVPAEVQAFLDAVAALPGASEVTAYNAEAVGEQVNAVLDLYEGLIDLGLDEAVGVAEALETVYAVYTMVLATADIDDSNTFAANKVTKSSIDHDFQQFGWSNDFSYDGYNYYCQTTKGSFTLNDADGVYDIGTPDINPRGGWVTPNAGSYYNFLVQEGSRYVDVTWSQSGTQLRFDIKPKANAPTGSFTLKISISFKYTTIGAYGGTTANGNLYFWYSGTNNVGGTTVTPGEKPEKPTDEAIEDFYNNNIAVIVRCVDQEKHSSNKYLLKGSRSRLAADSYTIGEVESYDGSNQDLSADEWGWMCKVHVNQEFYLNMWLKNFQSKNGIHYLKDASKDVYAPFYYFNGGYCSYAGDTLPEGWYCLTEDAPVYVDITHQAPVVTTYTVVYKDGNGGKTFGDESHGNKKVGDVTPAFSGSTNRTGYTFTGWKLNDTSTVLTNDQVKAKEIVAGDAVNSVITYTAVWEKNTPPTENKPSAPTEKEVNNAVKGSNRAAVEIYCQPQRHLVGYFDCYNEADAQPGVNIHPDRVTIGTVQGNDDDGYTCDVIFLAEKYLSAYNNLKKTTGDKAHVLCSEQGSDTTSEEANVTVTFAWNGTTWVLADGETTKCPDTTPKEKVTYKVWWIDAADGKVLKTEEREDIIGTDVRVTDADRIYSGYTYVGDNDSRNILSATLNTDKVILKMYFIKDTTKPPKIEVIKSNTGFKVDQETGNAAVDYTVTVKNVSGFPIYGLKLTDTLTPTLIKTGTGEGTPSATYTFSHWKVKETESGESRDITPISGEAPEMEHVLGLLARNVEFEDQQTVTLTYTIEIETNNVPAKVKLDNEAKADSWSKAYNEPQPKARMASAGTNPYPDDPDIHGTGSSSTGDGTIGGSGSSSTEGELPAKYTLTYTWNLPNNATPAKPLPTDTRASRPAGSHFTVDTANKQGDEATVDGKTYVFSGWTVPDDVTTETEGGQYKGQYVMPAHNVVITGEWTEKEAEAWTVWYNGDVGGTGNPTLAWTKGHDAAASSYNSADFKGAGYKENTADLTSEFQNFTFCEWALQKEDDGSPYYAETMRITAADGSVVTLHNVKVYYAVFVGSREVTVQKLFDGEGLTLNNLPSNFTVQYKSNFDHSKTLEAKDARKITVDGKPGYEWDLNVDVLTWYEWTYCYMEEENTAIDGYTLTGTSGWETETWNDGTNHHYFEAVAGVYDWQSTDKQTFTITNSYSKNPHTNLEVTAPDVVVTYDGNTHPVTPVVTLDGAPVTDATVTVKYTDAAGNTISGDPVNAGTYTATITVIRDGLTAKTSATVTISKRSLIITANSASKVYDGYVLTNNGYTFGGDGLVGTDQNALTVTVTGSQLLVGWSYNVPQNTWSNAAIGNNYNVTLVNGTLTINDYIYNPPVIDPGFVPSTPTPTPAPTPDTGTTITDEETPLAGSVGLNDTDHFAYVIGYEDDTVRPLNNITRAEAATIFFRLMTDEYRQANWSTTNSFSDVNTGDWYNNAVSTCANAGVLKGYEDGTFRPNAAITRAEFASMAAGFMDESITDDGTGDFSDTANHWAAVAIRRAAKAGWVTGNGNKFNPDAKITRAEVMTIVNRMLDRTPDKDHMLPEMKKWTDNPESEWYYEAVQEATNEHEYERDELNVETWTELLTERDWKALETEWANNGGTSTPKADTENK